MFQVPSYQVCELLEARHGLEHWTGLDWALHNKHTELVHTILEHVIQDTDTDGTQAHHDITRRSSNDSQFSDITHQASVDEKCMSDIREEGQNTNDMKLFRLVFPAVCWLGDISFVQTIFKQVPQVSDPE